MLTILEEHIQEFQLDFEELVSNFVAKPSILNILPKKNQRDLDKLIESIPDDLYEFTSSSLFNTSLGGILPQGKDSVVNKSPVKQDNNIGIEN